MSEQIKFKKKRLNKLLMWISANAINKGVTKHQIFEWLFDNYALGERTREKDLQDLFTFNYIIAKGTKFYVNPKKKPVW